MALPLMLERLQNDPTCASFEDIHQQLLLTAVPADKIIERVNELTELRSIIDATIADYMEDATERLHMGKQVSGFKLKKGRMSRTVQDEAKGIQLLRAAGLGDSAIFVSKMAGIPSIEKQLKALGKTDEDIERILKGFIQISYSADSATFA